MIRKVVVNQFVLFLFLVFIFPNESFSKKNDENSVKDTIITSDLVRGLKFRNIGPAWCSGRIADFAVNSENPFEYYVGVASGGVWKTVNNGTTWKPVFDKYGSYAIGDVEMDPSNNNVLWVGTGENNHQRALGYGDGIYKSVDGGESFENVGLKESRQIGGIVIDPRDGDVVFVACEGSAWGPGGDRGLYKTTDGGKTWNCVLEISENTGVNNVVIDPSNPDILYATSEQRRRTHFGKIGGGPESSVYKSTDNGDTWRKITKGLPAVHIGGMGIAVSPVNSDVVYLIVEAQYDKGGFYRSVNGGESWKRMSDYHSSGQYYNEIVCDPLDVDKVYSTETFTKVTVDGGKTWKRLGNNNRHVDDHALWIDPQNTSHLLIGGDGGIYETYDDGAHVDFKENLPVTQFYRVAVDNDYPFYNIYGGTQDNNSFGGPSQNLTRKGVTSDEWIETLGGDGFWQAIDPTDPNVVYSEYQYGNMVRFDKKSGEKVYMKPRERKGEEAYKWNWDSPLILSPHAHTRLYCAANKVFRSDDRGQSWQVISDDLTAQVDRNSLKMMDKFWSADAVVKHVSTSQWGTLVALDESTVQEGLIYAGSDDGVISVTEDNGASWFQIKEFPGVPQYTYCSDIQADKFDANIVYATFNNLKRDDFKPYVLRSNDKGRTWNSISSTLPDNESVHVIQQDHKNANLLFVGTELGVYFTVDAGDNWVKMKAGVPTIAVRDIAIQERENALVLATFGRGFYVLDDYSPLRDLSHDLVDSDAHLFPVKDALWYIKKSSRDNQGSSYYFAKNPDYGAEFTYYLKEVPKSKKKLRQEKEKELFKKGEFIPQPSWRELELEEQEEPAHLIFTIKDANGEEVNHFTQKPSKGISRVTWDLCYPTVSAISSSEFDPLKEIKSGMQVIPGVYSVEVDLVHNNETNHLLGPLDFQVKGLDNKTFPAADQKAVHDFNNLISNTVRSYNAVTSSLKEFDKKIETMLQTSYALTPIPTALVNELKSLSIQVDELKFVLYGVDAKASWEEIPPAQMPISRRVSAVRYARYSSTGDVLQTEKDNLTIINDELVEVVEVLTDFAKNRIPKVEQELTELDSNWIPGRIPVLK